MRRHATIAIVIRPVLRQYDQQKRRIGRKIKTIVLSTCFLLIVLSLVIKILYCIVSYKTNKRVCVKVYFL